MRLSALIRGQMRATTILLLCVLLPGVLHGMSVRKPPEAGIADKELEKLGDRADTELTKRFADHSNDAFREGLLMRMGAFGDLSHPNEKMREVLKSFVETEVASCDGQVELDRILRIGLALQVIGQRGGQPGLEYLKSWVWNPAVYGRIKCFSHKGDAASSHSHLRRNALLGIGRNGTKESLGILEDIAKHPPPDKYPGSFIGVLNGALSENKIILTEGVDKHFKSDRVYFLRRSE